MKPLSVIAIGLIIVLVDIPVRGFDVVTDIIGWLASPDVKPCRADPVCGQRSSSRHGEPTMLTRPIQEHASPARNLNPPWVSGPSWNVEDGGY